MFRLIFMAGMLLSFQGHAQNRIAFSEEEDITVNESYSRTVNARTLVIAKGDYEVIYDKANFGTVNLHVKSYVPTEEPVSNYIGIRIRIAKIHCKQYKDECVACIGFNCGLIKVDNYINHPRTKNCTLHLSKDGTTLTIQFTEFVDWESLK